MWKLNDVLLNNLWVKEEIKEKFKNTLEINGNTAHQNLWDALKVTLLREEFNKQPIFTPQS